MRYGNLKEVIQSWKYWGSDHVSTPNGSLYHHNGVLYSYGDHFPLAMRVSNRYLVNGDYYSATTAKHQSYLFREINQRDRVEIPFSALAKALVNPKYQIGSYGLNPRDLMENLNIIDLEDDVWLENGVDKDGETLYKHVLGGCVFSYTSEDSVRYFFSGIDETGLGTHRYFLTELVEEVNTVSEGLQSMKPREVIEAEKQGIEVKRQGEWFFIPCEEDVDLIAKIEASSTSNYILTNLETGEKGHHVATSGVYSHLGLESQQQYVKGIVKHTGKEHKQCKLYELGMKPKERKWFKAYHNVQKVSYTATGNVD